MSTTGEQPASLSGMKYLVESILGSAGKSTVMLVNDPKALSRRFAVKVIKREEPKDDALLARAEAAVTASEKLKHPSILVYHDFAKRKSFFKVNRGELLMEYVDGKSLDKLKKLSLDQWLLILRQVAAGLAHMHRRKVLHGDLDPSHVILSKSGQAKLINYGLAIVPREMRPEPSRLHASPEQLKEGRILEQSDVYALGALMYHTLTGQAARQAAAAGGGAGEGGAKVPAPSSLNVRIPTALNNLIVQCLSSKHEKRPESAYDVLRQLEAMVTERKLSDDTLRGLAADPR
jgi:serine/threonine-protein kinase